MSPVVIVAESLKLTMKPLAVIALVLMLFALLPAGSDAAEPAPAARTTLAATAVPAARVALKPARIEPAASQAGSSVRTVKLDLGVLNVASFGDNDEALR